MRAKVSVQLQAMLQPSSSVKWRPWSASFRGPKILQIVDVKSGLHRWWAIIIRPITVIGSLVRRPVCGLALSYGRWISFIFLFGRNLRIRSFNFFGVGKYGFLSILSHLSNNPLYWLWRHLSPTIRRTRFLHFPRGLFLLLYPQKSAHWIYSPSSYLQARLNA